jgi:hypothetical protein
MYEKRHHKLASKETYLKRLLKSFLIAICFLSFSLMMGILGYHYWGELDWLDALHNASMILGGMGPVDPIKTNSGKIFASVYAIYSGVSFLSAFSILIAPAFHRLMHKFHISNSEDDKE